MILAPALLWLPLGCIDYFVDGKNTTISTQTVTETFTQAPVPGVDVLFVIDSTGSMAEEQAGFGAAAGGFVASLDALGLDYQIGVTSMDVADEGALLGVPWILTPDDEGLAADLAKNLAVGTGSTPPSAGLDAAALALTDPLGFNIGFRRPDASLQVVFVSDADDDSGPVLGADPVSAFEAMLSTEASGNGLTARASAVVGDVPGGCTGTSGTALPGTRYAKVAADSGGTVASICAGDFSSIAAAIGAGSADWQLSFPLQADPIAGSAKVYVNTVLVESGWVIDDAGPALVFQTAPPPDALISVTYQLSAG